MLSARYLLEGRDQQVVFWCQRTQAVLQAVSAVQSGGSPSSDVQEALAAASSPVLRIIIDNMFYPVTLDVLQQVAFPHPLPPSVGRSVSKSGLFLGSSDFLQVRHSHEDNHLHQEQSVPGSSAVQRPRQRAAGQTGKALPPGVLAACSGLTFIHLQALDGQNIYNSCCTLRIDFSKLVNLNVKYNNDKSRDYTRPELPAGDGQPSLDPAVAAAFSKDSNSLLGKIPGRANLSFFLSQCCMSEVWLWQLEERDLSVLHSTP